MLELWAGFKLAGLDHWKIPGQEMWRKNVKILMKFEFLTFFQESSQINPEAFQDQKNNILMQKTGVPPLVYSSPQKKKTG